MPTTDWNRQHYQWDQPHPGAALMPSGQQHNALVPISEQHRAAAQARAYAYGMQRGRADAAAFRMQAARPFSAARRQARQRWVHEEALYIEASTFAQALTMEAAYNEFFGLY